MERIFKMDPGPWGITKYGYNKYQASFGDVEKVLFHKTPRNKNYEIVLPSGENLNLPAMIKRVLVTGKIAQTRFNP